MEIYLKFFRINYISKNDYEPHWRIPTIITKQNLIGNILLDSVESFHKHKNYKNIWENSKWKHINELENDYVGKVGEDFINKLCTRAKIPVDIDGNGNKKSNNGDGKVLNHTVEIKTARIGNDLSSFQHELGENPWDAEYIIFVDIAPKLFYITIFKNFSKDFYMESGRNSKVKCIPYFPSKSICWRKQKGAFKLDTTVKINENNKYTFKWTEQSKLRDFNKFVREIVL